MTQESVEPTFPISQNTPGHPELSSNHARTIPTSQGSENRKRKFSTLAPPPPTAAKRRVPKFVDGVPDIDPLSGTSRFKKLVKKATEVYNYDSCPLQKGHIRLLFLKPSKTPNDPIVIELESYPIEEVVNDPEGHQFTALSYNWGNEEESDYVFVDKEASTSTKPPQLTNIHEAAVAFRRRMRTLHVKPNLLAFLHQFRDRENEVALWVDRVCIDQTNNEEKQHQVSQMGIIYSAAASVSIWLGPADVEGRTDQAMDFIGSILQGHFEDKFRDKYARQWSYLLLLMRRRWFSRRWIIQELALSRTAEVRCGSKRVNWRDFSDAVSIFALHFEEILKIIKRNPDLERSLEGIKDMSPFGARILVDVLTNTFQRHPDGTIYIPRQGLESLISSLSTFETSDPRDTVYTLLNLAKETCKLLPRSQDRKAKNRMIQHNPAPVPDYTMDLLQVYTNFVRWCVKESNSLDIICRHWALPEIQNKLDDYYPRTVRLPSWITTVRDSAFGSQAEGFGGRRTGDSFVGTPETRCYNASLGLPPNISFGYEHSTQLDPTSSPTHSHSASFGTHDPQSQHDRMITVEGLCIGRITTRHPMHEGIIPKDVLKSLGHDCESPAIEMVPDAVWRTLVADRGPDGKPPPAWYHRACMTCLVADTNAGNMNTNSILQLPDTKNLQSGYLKRVQAVCWNRAFIECYEGDRKLVGIGPVKSEQGDLVCILYGCSVPCILRQSLHGDKPYYTFIGEAFVLGHMDGEAINNFSMEELRSASERFTIL